MSTSVGQRRSEKVEKGKEKGKGLGKGAKPISPTLDGPVESDTTRPLDSEEIQALAIRLDDLEKLHAEKKTDEERLRTFIVKKTKTGPRKQSIQVAKIAPQQPLQEHLISAGLRFDVNGRLLPYSILGSVNDYTAELSEIEIEQIRDENRQPQKIDDVPELSGIQKKCKHSNATSDGGGRSLDQWQHRMNERQQVMMNMSKQLKRTPATLLMNQTDRWRERKELLTLLDVTLPLLENGKNARLNSEFWTQQQLVGDDDTGIHTTLTRTELGLPPSFETIGKPQVGLQETGIDLNDKQTSVLYRREWFNSDYLDQRLKQLNPLMNEILPHQAQVSSLEILGHAIKPTGTTQKTNIEVNVFSKNNPMEITDTVQMEEDDELNQSDLLGSRPDVTEPSLMGPALKIVTYVFQQMAHIDENEELDFIYEIRVPFDSQVNERVTRTVEIKNVGTTVFYYEWQLKPYTKPFDIINSKVQRFYFDNRTSSILPNDTLKVSFVFKSGEAGIFTERWQLLTRPVLCGGRPIIFTLRGVTTAEDVHQQKRLEIEKMLHHREAESIARTIVANILDNVRTPERARSPVGFYMTEQEQFQEINPDLYFDYEIFELFKRLYEQVVTDFSVDPWNLSVENLRKRILSLNEDHPQKQDFLEQLNRASTQLTLQPLAPTEQTTYLVCYDIFNQFIDSFVDEMSKIHQTLQIKEPNSESYPDIDLNGYQFESWRKFFEYTKAQETDKRAKSAAGGGAAKEKKITGGKPERGKSPKKSPAPSQAPSAAGKRGTTSGNVSQLSKPLTFVSPAKPDKERTPLSPEQVEERARISQASYLPIYTLLCKTFDRFEQALDGLTECYSTNENAHLYTQLASSIQNQSLNVLDILKDELTRNVTSIDMNNFFE